MWLWAEFGNQRVFSIVTLETYLSSFSCLEKYKFTDFQKREDIRRTYSSSTWDGNISELVLPVVPKAWSLNCNHLQTNLQPAKCCVRKNREITSGQNRLTETGRKRKIYSFSRKVGKKMSNKLKQRFWIFGKNCENTVTVVKILQFTKRFSFFLWSHVSNGNSFRFRKSVLSLSHCDYEHRQYFSETSFSETSFQFAKRNIYLLRTRAPRGSDSTSSARIMRGLRSWLASSRAGTIDWGYELSVLVIIHISYLLKASG